MRQLSLALAAVAALSIAAPASAADIINENFEAGLGAFTATGQAGINTGNGYNFCCSTFGSAGAMANHFVAFGSNNQPSGLIMTSPILVAGQTYHLTFDYGALGVGSETLTLSLLEYSVSFSQLVTANNNMDTTFQTAAFDILGSGGLLTFQFQSSGVSNVDAIIDNIHLTGLAAAVPEPATWAMMLLGFGGIGFAIRRRKERAALA
jgi:hypothetical protein